MKKALQFVLGFIFFTGMILYLPTAVTAREVTPDEIIRLHVIANSDEKADQDLKLEVRDEIVTLLQPNLLKAKDRDGAEAILIEHLSEIEKVAQNKVDSEGFSYPVKAVIGDFNFPIKAYNNFIAPAGEYRALKVIIGEGAGANWWCVMFPPICLVDLKHQVTSKAEAAITTVKLEAPIEEGKDSEPEAQIEVRFKIVELWQSLTSKLNSLF